MKKKLKGLDYLLIILIILFVTWLILSLTLVDFSRAKGYYWGGFSFITIAFIFAAGVIMLLKYKKTAVPLSVPYWVLLGAYFGISFVLNTIFMCLLGKGNTKAVVIPNITIILIFVATLVGCYYASNKIEDNDKQIKENVSKLKKVYVEIGQIVSIATDSDVICALNDLREKVNYSDPMGTNETEAYEIEFLQQIDKVKMLVEGHAEVESIMGMINTAKNKLIERNELLRSLK